MDPLTAFGLASNVVSFIQFASGFIKGGVEVYQSASGSSEAVVRLENVCEKLKSLNEGLRACSHRPVVDSNSELTKRFLEVQSVAEACYEDCETLLEITRKLRTQDSKGLHKSWSSFRVALRKAWNQSKIDDLEERLKRSQVTLTLHICYFSSLHHDARAAELESLQHQSIQLQINHTAQIENITVALHRLKTEISHFNKTNSAQGALKVDDLASLEKQFDHLAISHRNIQLEQQVLKSLHLSILGVRREAIPEAYGRTFRWALDENTRIGGDGKEPTSLSQWLRRGNDIFWVTGKPGSGKSTFMKFIASAEETQCLLARWQPTRCCIVASHYFWNAGSMVQKSLEGLLRGLLYEIFRQVPSLINLVCGPQLDGNDKAAESQSWSRTRLHETLEKAVRRAADHNNSICFFIDGLDEFAGDHDHRVQLCQLFSKLSQPSHTKICLSSRPWNVFDEAFGSSASKLYLHDLTRQDIEDYVRSRLEGHPRWCQISASESENESLAAEVRERASGVFLWVYLVTKLLCEGLTNQDRITDLRRRVQSFPEELEDFFQHILDSVEPFYHSKMSTILQIALTAREPLKFPIYEFHDMEYDDPNYALKLHVDTPKESELGSMRSRVAYQLNSRTRGLLEISASGVVDFLHRTVRDFLGKQEIVTLLQQRMSRDLNFDPNWSILQALSAWIKLQPAPASTERRYWADYVAASRDLAYDHRIVSNSLPVYTMMACKYTQIVDGQGSRSLELRNLLDDLEAAISQLLGPIRCTTSGYIEHKPEWPKTIMFREQLIACGVIDYVKSKTKEDPEYLLSLPSDWVWSNLVAERNIGKPERLPSNKQRLGILQYLLHTRKLQPNRCDRRGKTLWGTILMNLVGADYPNTILGCNCEVLLPDLLEEENILSMLVLNGADPNITIARHRSGPVTCLRSFTSLAAQGWLVTEERQQAFLGVFDQLVSSGMDLFGSPPGYSALDDIFTILCDPGLKSPPALAMLIAILGRVADRARATGASAVERSLESRVERLDPPQLRCRVMAALGLDRPKAKRCLTDCCEENEDQVTPKRART